MFINLTTNRIDRVSDRWRTSTFCIECRCCSQTIRRHLNSPSMTSNGCWSRRPPVASKSKRGCVCYRCDDFHDRYGGYVDDRLRKAVIRRSTRAGFWEVDISLNLSLLYSIHALLIEANADSDDALLNTHIDRYGKFKVRFVQQAMITRLRATKGEYAAQQLNMQINARSSQNFSPVDALTNPLDSGRVRRLPVDFIVDSSRKPKSWRSAAACREC